MRRLTLSTKLFAAALPLILAVGALLALTVRNDLEEVDHAERGASLGSLWTPLVGAMTAIARAAEKGEVLTGLLYVSADAEDLHAHLHTYDAKPFNQLDEKDLCPGAATLDKINAALR